MAYPIYNSSIHKAGDMVRTKWDNKLIPAIVLDDMGRAFLNPTQGEIIAIRKRSNSDDKWLYELPQM